MGILIGVGNSKPTFPYDYYYGIEWDTTVSNPACTRLGKAELHVTTPIQAKMRRCLLADDGTVTAYLDPNNSTKLSGGGDADLTGASGQVMVEIPKHYRKFEVEGTKMRCFLSEYALPGFDLVPKCYVSAYEATVDRSAATLKLCSVVNNATAFRGGNNNADWDGTYRSLLGRPATNISTTNFRAYARNRGAAGLNNAGWNCYVYDVHKTIFWLYSVEYANFNCQAAFNAQLDANNYHQGGLGMGVSQISGWSGYNGYNPFVPCGVTNSLGNATGIVTYNVIASDGESVYYAAPVPSYRGIENPFGHVFKMSDGCKVQIQADGDGGKSNFFVCSDPAKFQSTNYDDYVKRGELPRTEGWVKKICCGAFGDMVPALVGGSSSTYFCDYFYTSVPSSGEAQRAVFFGGNANDGANGGFACALSNYDFSHAYSTCGSRLCFLPA